MILQTLTNLTLRLIVNLMLPHQKKEGREERNAKLQLWKSLTESLKSKMREERASEPKSDNILAEKQTIPGKLSLVLTFTMKLKSGSI